MDAIYKIFNQYSSPIFLTSDFYNPLVIHKAKEYGFLGYFIRNESSRLFIRAILNPSLRKFWLSESAVIEVQDLPMFNLYYQLTSREKEIFPLLADGMGYKEIGFKLGISSKTVLSHRERLMKKMRFETTTDMIRAAIKLGVTQL